MDKKTGTVISTEKTEVTFSQAKKQRRSFITTSLRQRDRSTLR